MKQFSLEEAKAGMPVCTRCGQSVRIICWDRVYDNRPIVALIGNDEKYMLSYPITGIYRPSGEHSEEDLMMATECYINIFRCGGVQCVRGHVYKTREAAEAEGKIYEDYITTIQIERKE